MTLIFLTLIAIALALLNIWPSCFHGVLVTHVQKNFNDLGFFNGLHESNCMILATSLHSKHEYAYRSLNIHLHTINSLLETGCLV